MTQNTKASVLHILLKLETMEMLLNECGCDDFTKDMFFNSTDEVKGLRKNAFALPIMLEMEAAFTDLRQLMRRRDHTRKHTEVAMSEPDPDKLIEVAKNLVSQLMQRLYVVYTARTGPPTTDTSLLMLSGMGPRLVCKNGSRVITR